MSNPNNDGLFEQVLQAQETQREGWMPDPVAEKDAEIDRLKKELGDSQEVAQDAIRCISNAMTNPFYGKHFQAALQQDFTSLTLRLKALTSQRQ